MPSLKHFLLLVSTKALQGCLKVISGIYIGGILLGLAKSERLIAKKLDFEFSLPGVATYYQLVLLKTALISILAKQMLLPPLIRRKHDLPQSNSVHTWKSNNCFKRRF